ncbi:cytidylyltransferase domain-containing protein [Mesorhizobium sp. 1B3]|uniref:acylneuraminate cytidylyltransferase family protein n=1 Tax=Mesorhizobium sp. 1B3 TaxID=3243599 RepID=UPI003D967C2E
MTHDEVISVIPARGGSKGIPGKNLADLNGKPLLAWSILAALESGAVDRVIVSTDSAEIADVAHHWGAEVPFTRPAPLASDDIHAVHVALHALDWLEQQEGYVPAGVMMLLPTSPLRLAEDVRGAADLFRETGAPAVVSVVDLGKYMTNLRYLDGMALERVASEENPNAQRQGLRKLYSVNGSIFLARPGLLRESGTFHVEGALGYEMATFNSIDINSFEDLRLARQISEGLHPWNSRKEVPQ